MRFQKARDVAFQNFMNEFDRTPQYIAIYMDSELKKGFKQLSEDEIVQEVAKRVARRLQEAKKAHATLNKALGNK